MTKRSFAPAAALLAALAGPAAATAQDAHYWTYGYGPVGQLTEGTLVGGVEDLSAVYYNPGALALIDEPRFLFGLTSIELATIKAPDAAGQNLDFDSFVFDIVPSVVAGHIGKNDGQANHFAFAFLSRHDTDWDLGYSNAQVSAASPDGAAGFGRVRERVVEYWVGGTWSHRVSESLSFGVSPFVAYRAQRSRRSLTLEDLAAGTSRAVFVAKENEYNHGRLLAKAGIAWRPGHWELGATVTTAGLGIYEHRQGGLQRVGRGRGVGAVPLREHPEGARRHVPLPVVGGGRGDVARPAHRDPHDGRVVLGRRPLRHPHPGARPRGGQPDHRPAHVPGRRQEHRELRRSAWSTSSRIASRSTAAPRATPRPGAGVGDPRLVGPRRRDRAASASTGAPRAWPSASATRGAPATCSRRSCRPTRRARRRRPRRGSAAGRSRSACRSGADPRRRSCRPWRRRRALGGWAMLFPATQESGCAPVKARCISITAARVRSRRSEARSGSDPACRGATGSPMRTYTRRGSLRLAADVGRALRHRHARTVQRHRNHRNPGANGGVEQPLLEGLHLTVLAASPLRKHQKRLALGEDPREATDGGQPPLSGRRPFRLERDPRATGATRETESPSGSSSPPT